MIRLNDKIVAYLRNRNIEFSAADFMVVLTNGVEAVVKWNVETLGVFPSTELLDAAFATYQQNEFAAQVRTQRDELLAQTDWTQAADVPQAIKDKWASYRQALRDVPQQPGFPDSVTWPTKP